MLQRVFLSKMSKKTDILGYLHKKRYSGELWFYPLTRKLYE